MSVPGWDRKPVIMCQSCDMLFSHSIKWCDVEESPRSAPPVEVGYRPTVGQRLTTISVGESRRTLAVMGH